MTDPANPLGIRDIDHLEFTCNDLNGPTAHLFNKFGFNKTHHSANQEAHLYVQGQIRFLLINAKSEKHHAYQYFQSHGEGVSKISFLVEDAETAIKEACLRGAELIHELTVEETSQGPIKSATIQGFGDVHNEFIERPMSIFRTDFKKADEQPSFQPLDVRAARIDHLTHNVPKGEMDHWANFYTKIFGFEEIRYFDIKGQKTGLLSRAMGLKNKRVIIPINEPEAENGKSQIQEFLDLHKGAGVQHIAFLTPDIISTVQELQSRGIKFLSIPHTYYEDIPARNFTVEENIDVLEQRQILVDGDADGYLLQNFTDTYIGPLFFEVIQRKNHFGFGEGNFNALFASIERDQMQRGYLK